MGGHAGKNGTAALVLSALPLEYRAIRAHLTGLRRITHEMGTEFEVGHRAGAPGDVITGCTGEGNLAAAVVTGRAIEAFHPQVVFFVGVAGALKDDLEVGDVVVATRVYAVHGAKQEQGRTLARPNAFNAAHELLDLAQHLDITRESWVDSARAGRVGFRVHFKPVAAGEVVLDGCGVFLASQLYEHYNDAAAIEMESAGVAVAAHLNRAVPMLTVRGISDKADGHKQPADAVGGQLAAAAHAAQVAFAVIRQWAANQHPSAPLPLADSGA
jgi:nucleoside phosphorylase